MSLDRIYTKDLSFQSNALLYWIPLKIRRKTRLSLFIHHKNKFYHRSKIVLTYLKLTLVKLVIK